MNAARTRRGVRLATLFAASQIALWTGCNAILGNGYGAFDESAVGPNGPGGEGGPGDDALGGEGGGPGADGGPGNDGNANTDANVIDGTTGEGGGPCPRMLCPAKLVSATAPQRLAVNASAVYWTDATGIGRVALDGSDVVMPVTVPGGTIVPTLTRGVALQGGVPYVTAGDRGAAKCTSTLSSCTNMPFIGSAGISSSIGTDSSKVYVGIYDDGSGKGGLFQTDLNGSAASAMAYAGALEQVSALRVVGSTVFYLAGTDLKYVTSLASAAANATAVDATVAFDVVGSTLVIATSSNVLRACNAAPTANCTMVNLLVRSVPITALVLDGAKMIWAEGGPNGAIYRASVAPNPTVELLADKQASPVDLAVDSTAIYWVNAGNTVAGSGGIMKLAK
jgi:hypothetical protein